MTRSTEPRRPSSLRLRAAGAALAALVVIAAASLTPLARAGDARSFRAFQGEVMSTRFEVRLPDSSDAAAAAEEVFAIFADVDARMSEWKPSSPLSAVNREAGIGPVAVPDDLRAVVRRGVEIGELTGGAFDVTWAALWGLWDFKAASPTVPDPAEIARRVALVDYRQVQVDEAAGTVMLARIGMKVGLGGIAKGWALDRAAAALRGRGIENFLMTGGGQVYAAGDKGGGAGWKVGVRDPRGPADDFFAIVPTRDASVSTSGDYERSFFVDGVRYHHILDPKTGAPSRGLRSATVLSGDATLADALSTAMMVLGAAEGLALAEQIPGTEALLVDAGGGVHVSSGLRESVVMAHLPAGPGFP